MGGNTNGGNNSAALNCVCEVVRFIDSIQPPLVSPVSEDSCPTGCLRENLGPVGGAMNGEPNTRPFLLYNCEGELFSAIIPGEGENCINSPVFRVEGFFGDEDTSCCAILRVLDPSSGGGPQADAQACRAIQNPCDIEATNICIIVDLTCFCAIQCLQDIFLEAPTDTITPCNP